MSTLRINYDQLKKLESLPQRIKNDVIRSSLRSSISNTRETVSEFAFKKLEKSRLISFDRNVQKKRITFSKITEGFTFETIKGYIRFSTINESLSSFPWRRTTTRGTDGKTYTSFIAKVLGRTIMPMPKTFISKKKLWSVKRTTNKQYPVRKSYIDNSSISDLLRFDNNLLNAIISRSNKKYESEIQRKIRWNLMKIQ